MGSARGQSGQEGQRSHLTPRATSDIEACELEHELVGGFFGDGRGIGIEAQELAACGSKGFGGVGEIAEVADSHKPTRKDMKQEAADEFLDWEFLGYQPITLFSVAVSEGDLPIVD